MVFLLQITQTATNY